VTFPDYADRSPRGRRLPLLIGLAVVALAVVGVAAWWLTRDDAPAEADLANATASVDDGDTTEAGDGSDGGSGSSGAGDTDPAGDDAAGTTRADGVEGTWTVDTTVGEFSFEDSTGTFVGFRVREELTGLGELEAVGRTPQVVGTVTIEGQTVTAALIEANVAAITTNDGRRDNRVRSALDVEGFPSATFELTSPIELGPEALTGEPVAATASGDLTVHGVTRPVEVDLPAQLVDDTIVVVGAMDVSFGDFGVSVPSAPIVLAADDFGVVELQLFLARS
jgi:polyisoprenoid-binding protein YceI